MITGERLTPRTSLFLALSLVPICFQSVNRIYRKQFLRLLVYDRPGTVRELAKVVARALVLNPEPVLQLGDLPVDLREPVPARPVNEGEEMILEELERRTIYRAMEKTGGNKIAAAQMLGIGKTTLCRKLHRYNHRSIHVQDAVK